MISCRDCGNAFVFATLSGGCSIGQCGCFAVPVVDGVVIADRRELRTRVLHAIERGECDEARELILGSYAVKLRWLTRVGIKPRFDNYARHRLLSAVVSTLHLRRILRALPPKRLMKTLVAAAEWNPYIRHRFSSPSMLATIPWLGLVSAREGPVLDAPCGMGHLSFLLSKIVTPQRVVSMDLSPPSVYSARRFFVPALGAAIVRDMNLPLPFAEDTFAAVFCVDAFHYVRDRKSLAREFMRIIRPDGVVVIAHAHNRLTPNLYSGYAMAPEEYAALFKRHGVRVVPESAVLDAYLDNAPLDLTCNFSDQELQTSPALHIVAAKSPDAFTIVPPVRDRLINASSNPRLNALYRMRQRNDQIVFERRLPEGLRADFEAYQREILPQRVAIPAWRLRRDHGRDEFSNARELLARHVLIDLPPEY